VRIVDKELNILLYIQFASAIREMIEVEDLICQSVISVKFKALVE